MSTPEKLALLEALEEFIREEVARAIEPLKAQLNALDDITLDQDDKRDFDVELSELREDLEHRIQVVAADVDDLTSGLRDAEARIGDLESSS